MRYPLLLFSLIFNIYFAFADYDPSLGLEYAYASSLSYCNPPNVQSWDCGQACQNLTGYQPYYSADFPVAADQSLSFSMIYNPSAKKFVTAFRGTVGNLELLSEILEDSPVPYQLANVSNAEVLKYFYNHYSNDLRANFTQKLQEFYAANSDYSFVFTGHSLGAALSTLAAFDSISSGYLPSNKVTLYNYGSPRVGNYAFAEAVKSTVPVIYRVTHWNDLVPHVPPCMTNSSGVCVSGSDAEDIQDSGIIWPAWHIAPEAFYDKASYSYKVCVESEDPNCTDQFQLLGTNMLEHYHYLNVSMECDGNMVVKGDMLLNKKATEEMQFGAMFVGW